MHPKAYLVDMSQIRNSSPHLLPLPHVIVKEGLFISSCFGDVLELCRAIVRSAQDAVPSREKSECTDMPACNFSNGDNSELGGCDLWWMGNNVAAQPFRYVR